MAKPTVWCIAALSLTTLACQSPGNVGLDATPASVNDAGVYVTDTLTLVMYNAQLDSVSTFASERLLVGAMEDAYTGPISSQAIIQPLATTLTGGVSLVGNPSLPANALIDSSIIFFYSQYVGGDTSNATTYELVMGSDTIGARPRYAFERFNLGGAQSIATYEAGPGKYCNRAWRFNALGLVKNLLGDAPTIFADNNLFIKQVKALAIRPRTTPYAVVALNIGNTLLGGNPLAYWDIYYRVPGSTASNITRIRFSTSNPRTSQVTYARQAPFSALDRDGALVSTSKTENTMVLQAGSGLRGIVKIPALDKLKAQNNGRFQLLKAELQTSTIPDDVSRPGRFMEQVTLVEANGNNRTRFVNGAIQTILNDQLYNGVTGNFSNIRNLTTNKLTLNITQYVSGVINGKIPNTGFIVQPSNLANDILSMGIADQQHPDPNMRAKLVLYYIKN